MLRHLRTNAFNILILNAVLTPVLLPLLGLLSLGAALAIALAPLLLVGAVLVRKVKYPPLSQAMDYAKSKSMFTRTTARPPCSCCSALRANITIHSLDPRAPRRLAPPGQCCRAVR
jgi:hypothetical protein